MKISEKAESPISLSHYARLKKQPISCIPEEIDEISYLGSINILLDFDMLSSSLFGGFKCVSIRDRFDRCGNFIREYYDEELSIQDKAMNSGAVDGIIKRSDPKYEELMDYDEFIENFC